MKQNYTFFYVLWLWLWYNKLMMKKGNEMNKEQDRTYKDIAAMADSELSDALLNLQVDRYMNDHDMNDPVMAREIIREALECTLSTQSLSRAPDRADLIDELYNYGYWA